MKSKPITILAKKNLSTPIYKDYKYYHLSYTSIESTKNIQIFIIAVNRNKRSNGVLLFLIIFGTITLFTTQSRYKPLIADQFHAFQTAQTEKEIIAAKYRKEASFKQQHTTF